MAIEEDFYVGVQGLVTIPVWPLKLVIVIGALVTAPEELAALKEQGILTDEEFAAKKAQILGL